MLPAMLATLDDQALMLRYGSDGDVAAFEELYGRYRGPLYRYLLRQCGNPDAAQDLYQETWARVIRARADYVWTTDEDIQNEIDEGNYEELFNKTKE